MFSENNNEVGEGITGELGRRPEEESEGGRKGRSTMQSNSLHLKEVSERGKDNLQRHHAPCSNVVRRDQEVGQLYQ